MLKMSQLRKDRDFNRLMANVLEALKGVASSEYFRLQSERKGFVDFDNHLKSFFESLKLNNFKHPFFNPPPGPKNIILITSDASFLGKLNMEVVNSGFNEYREGDFLTVVGRQGVRYVEESARDFTFFKGIDDNISYSAVESLQKYIIDTFLEKKLSGTIIVYPHFVSFAVQNIQQLQVFPSSFLFSGQDEEKSEDEEKTIIEPSSRKIFEYLMKVWLSRSLYHIFWESKLSEWAARVMHLDKSVDETKRQDRHLKLNYFRLLHQISDQNIRETYCNRMVLDKKGKQ